MSEDHLVPSVACLEDAEFLDYLFFNRPQRQFTLSPAQVELQHSKSVFEDLISKHEGCHEATFGLGRVCILEGEYGIGGRYLQHAVAMTGADPVYYAWLAWAFLLDSSSRGLMVRSANLSRACQYCQQAVQMSRDCTLALRCLVHLAVSLPLSASGGWPAALSHAKTVACAHPVPGLYLVARTLLQDRAQAQTGITGLRQCISEIPISGEGADEVAAAITEQSLGSDAPVLLAVGADARCGGSSSASPSSDMPLWQAWDRKVVSVKLLALNTLWHYLKQSALQEEAAEVALLAIAALRACPAAWQRAVCLALKSLAFQGRWDQCWHLAAAELAYKQSFEVLYQCGRLAYYDGRHEAIDAYLPHLCAMLPVVPASVRADVQFWIGMLYQKRGHGLLALRSLQAAAPALEAEETPKRRSKIERCKGIIASVAKVEAEVKRIYDFSNEALKSAIARHMVQRPSRDISASALEATFSAGFDCRVSSPEAGDDEGTTLFASNGETSISPEPGESVDWSHLARLALPEQSGHWTAGDLRKYHQLAMSDLQSSLYSAPWKLLGSWSGAKTATSVEIDDPFLGKMCRGRLTLIQGDASGAEALWESAAMEFPAHLEPYVELWQLHSAQGIHKKAVLDIRRAVELVTSRKSSWGKYVPIPLDLLLHGKMWPGVGVGASSDIEQVVHLLLAKALCRCRLWEHAWQALCNGFDASGRSAEGVFSYQMGKLSVKYVQELLAAHLREKQNGRAPADEASASSQMLSVSAAATDSAGEESWQQQEGGGDVEANATSRGDEYSDVDLWLERAREHLDVFVKYESTEADHRKGLVYRTKLDACTMLLSRVRQLCKQTSAPATHATTAE